jgi:hypothetical protein
MKAPFDEVEMRRKLQQRLNATPGIQIEEEYIGGRPGIEYDSLTQEDDLQHFLNAFDWYISEIRTAEANDA